LLRLLLLLVPELELLLFVVHRRAHRAGRSVGRAGGFRFRFPSRFGIP